MSGNLKNKLVVGVDFDGTCVTHEYPKIGRDIGAVPVLKELVNSGHKLILWTMRSHKLTEKGVDTLQDAIDWFQKNEIPLWGINENPEQKSWTDGNKQYANLYIDDAALGCPLIYNEIERPFVDWIEIQKFLKESNII
jgi:hypothetical protein